MASEEKTAPPAPASERLANDMRPASVLPIAAIAVIASLLGVGLGLLIDWFPVAAATQADQVDTLYDVLIIASVPMFVLVVSVVLYNAIHFRMRPGQENMDGPPIHGNTKLEVIWTIIPAVMMLGLCTYAYAIMVDAEDAPAAAGGGAPKELKVDVVGEQFTWTFFYPSDQSGGKAISSPQLYLPKDRSVEFRVRAKDVLHDLWVPAFRWKIDAVPGIVTKFRVTPTRLGNYEVVCAELCGLGHAVMRQSAHVLDGGEFDKWLEDKRAGKPEGGGGAGGAAAGGTTGGADGKEVFTASGCGNCHTLADAGTSGSVGPDLGKVLKGKDAAFIEESVVDPGKEVAKGFPDGVMPPDFGEKLSPEELDALVKYLEEATNG
jgi:cytochrome c oxidase subunit II